MSHPEFIQQRAVAAYETGRTIRCIADDLNIADTAIYRWLHAAGVTLRSKRPGYEHMASLRKVDPAELRRLHAEGKNDCQIARELGSCSTRIRQLRVTLKLPANAKVGWPYPGPGRGGKPIALALALMLLAGGAQAQGTGWQGHPTGPDPFMNMKTGDGRSCCSAVDCAYTDDCVTAGKNEPGVIGPDGQCHALTEAALKTKNCAPGGTSACFYKGQMLCACTSGT